MRKALILALLLGIPAFGCARSSAKPDESLYRVRQAGVLRVVMDPSYPPFSFADGKGTLTGFDIDLAREVASRLGVTASFVGVDVTSAMDALVADRADAAISAISPSWEYGWEYGKEIRFSRGYFNAGQVLVEWVGSGQGVKQEGIETARLGVEIGSAGELEARKLAKEKPGMTVIPLSSLEAGIASLSSGETDALVADRVTAVVLLQGQEGLRIAGETLTYEPYAIAVRGSDRALLKEIDTILEEMASDGFLASLETRWIEARVAG